MESIFVQGKVEDAFQGTTRDEFGQKYLELLYGNWSEMARTLRRTVLLSVLMVISFLLLDHAKSAELAVGPLKTDNVAAVLTVLPAATSFFLFEAIDLTLAGSYYRDVANAVIKNLYPSVYKNHLQLLLMPGTTFAWGAGFEANLAPRGSGKIAIARIAMGLVVILAVVVSMLVFLAYAYIRLYGNDHTNFLAVSASLIFAVFNVTRAGLHVVEDFSNDFVEPDPIGDPPAENPEEESA